MEVIARPNSLPQTTNPDASTPQNGGKAPELDESDEAASCDPCAVDQAEAATPIAAETDDSAPIDGAPRDQARHANSGVLEYVPTPDDIHRECEAIKAGWSPWERYRRAAYDKGETRPRDDWEPPTARNTARGEPAGE